MSEFPAHTIVVTLPLPTYEALAALAAKAEQDVAEFAAALLAEVARLGTPGELHAWMRLAIEVANLQADQWQEWREDLPTERRVVAHQGCLPGAGLEGDASAQDTPSMTADELIDALAAAMSRDDRATIEAILDTLNELLPPGELTDRLEALLLPPIRGIDSSCCARSLEGSPSL